ncbi:hypothetical protein F0562_034335 [Nyssa sinensis]|uniref:Uncharacterized protein n=1 Tax=Nyssa sinensis TaxID=561372 RepID=A0A5J5AI33_9ASTE|nr:hypothetical protein F0562_034335 [Nyssa sinensis]
MREIDLIESTSVGRVQKVTSTESILVADVPREEAQGDTIPSDGIPAEQASLASVSKEPIVANDVLNPFMEIEVRASLVISLIFEVVTDVNNNSPVLPFSNLESDEDTPSATVEA